MKLHKKTCEMENTSTRGKSPTILRPHTCTDRKNYQRRLKKRDFNHLKTAGLEGPAWLLGDLEERWSDIEDRKIILDALRLIENESTLMGISAHILAIAQKV